jgi:type IV pilus assembly protein PilF
MKKLSLIAVILLAACAGPQARDAANGESDLRESARIHTELGAGYYAQNQIGIALEEFTDAVKIDPSYASAYNGLGLVYSALGEEAKAEANFNKSIQLEPGNPETRNNYGTFLCSRNKIDESMVQFAEAVKNPLYATPGVAYMNAGVCSLRKQDEKNAEVFLRKALQVQPLLHQAAYQLALLQFNHKEYKPARSTLTNALASNPTPEILWLGIRIERILGDKDAEASYALSLRQKYPNSEQAKALLSGQ